jgi:hypothetical protein
MIFKEMDPKEVLQLLEGHENVLAPEVERHEAYFRKLQCVYCGGSCHPFVSPENLFESGSMLPKYLAECSDCGCQFEPYTKIELRGPQRNPLEESEPG